MSSVNDISLGVSNGGISLTTRKIEPEEGEESTVISDITLDAADNLNFISGKGATYNLGEDLEIISQGNISIKAKKDMFLESRQIITIDASELELKGVRPVQDFSGALSCIPTCPFTGVSHWYNRAVKVERNFGGE